MLVFTPSLIQIGVISHTSVMGMLIPGVSGPKSLIGCSFAYIHQNHANVELQELVKDIFLGT